jgi:hypothetical protein
VPSERCSIEEQSLGFKRLIHQVGKEPKGNLGCISPCLGTYRACVLWILASYYVMLCATSQIASLCDRVSVLLPYRRVSGLPVYLAYLLFCRHDVAYHFVPSGSDGV